MVDIKDYGEFETAWCPGCGNFSILAAVKKSLASLNISPHQVLFVSGIGQAAKAPHYLNANLFNGLHGRAIPAATGAKIANKNLNVIVESGDGCIYGEGGNHFLAAIRRNANITVLVHNNKIYGLTKGQTSPTSDEGFITKAQPWGNHNESFNPIAVSIAMHAGFVARGFSGKIDHLSSVISQAIAHNGFSIVDILHPCVSFNKINTYVWYNKRCYELNSDHDPTNWKKALQLAYEWDEKIPIGVIYKNDRPAYEDRVKTLKGESLVKVKPSMKIVETIIKRYM